MHDCKEHPWSFIKTNFVGRCETPKDENIA